MPRMPIFFIDPLAMPDDAMHAYAMLRRHEASFFRGSLATPPSPIGLGLLWKGRAPPRTVWVRLKVATRGPFGGCLRPQEHISGQNSASTV